MKFSTKRFLDDIYKKGIVHASDWDQPARDRALSLEKLGFLIKEYGSWSGQPIYTINPNVVKSGKIFYEFKDAVKLTGT